MLCQFTAVNRLTVNEDVLYTNELWAKLYDYGSLN